MATNLSFQKIATVPASGLIVGRIYFETSTGMIKVATSATAVDKFGDGVKSASWDESAKTLKIINERGEEISLNLSDVVSASAVTTELAKKLNIGASGDASTVQSYYGLKKYTDEAKSSAISSAKSYTDTEIGTLDKTDTAVAGQVVSAVSETDGIITVSRRALVADDIPTLAISKISELDTALNEKVPTTRTVNSKPLSANVVLAGADILVGGDGTYGENDLQTAIEAMDSRITSAAASRVQSFGGQTGAITVDTANTTNGQVKFSMSSKQLKGTVNGLKSAAYTESSAYATSAQGDKADSAIQEVNGTVSNYIATSKSETTVTVTSMLQAVASASSTAKGLAEASDVKAYADGLMTWVEFE